MLKFKQKRIYINCRNLCFCSIYIEYVRFYCEKLRLSGKDKREIQFWVFVKSNLSYQRYVINICSCARCCNIENTCPRYFHHAWTRFYLKVLCIIIVNQVDSLFGLSKILKCAYLLKLRNLHVNNIFEILSSISHSRFYGLFYI